MTRIGLISDTHGLLRPEALAYLAGSAHIVHAGDIGKAEVLEQLAALAPLTAVRGNVDAGPWTRALGDSALLEMGGVRIYVAHDIAEVDLDLECERIDVLVTGHSHQPRVAQRGRVLHVNPGSAGPRRFTLPVSAGELLIDRAGHCTASTHTLVIA